VKFNELLQKSVFECAGTVRINFCTFMYHSRLVGSNRAGSVGLAFGSTILDTQERTLHAILFAGDAVEGLGEGVAADAVLVVAAATGNADPTAARILLDVVAGYAKLGGGADSRTRHSEVDFSAPRRSERYTITTKVVASAGDGIIFSKCSCEHENDRKQNENQSKNTLHDNTPFTNNREELV